MTYKTDDLIDKVLEQIKKDVVEGDLTAVEELLKSVSFENLKGFLPEIEKQGRNFK